MRMVLILLIGLLSSASWADQGSTAPSSAPVQTSWSKSSFSQLSRKEVKDLVDDILPPARLPAASTKPTAK
jgi:hypothetical protein